MQQRDTNFWNNIEKPTTGTARYLNPEMVRKRFVPNETTTERLSRLSTPMAWFSDQKVMSHGTDVGHGPSAFQTHPLFGMDSFTT